MNFCLHSADNGFPSYSRTCRCSPPISHRRAARHSGHRHRHSGPQILERLLVFKLWTIVHNCTSIHSVSRPQNCPFCYISVANCAICEHGYVHDIIELFGYLSAPESQIMKEEIVYNCFLCGDPGQLCQVKTVNCLFIRFKMCICLT